MIPFLCISRVPFSGFPGRQALQDVLPAINSSRPHVHRHAKLLVYTPHQREKIHSSRLYLFENEENDGIVGSRY